MAALVVAGSQAQASLSLSCQFVSQGNWSLDAVGSNSTPVGDIQAVGPAGSTVQKAFLYSSSWSWGAPAKHAKDLTGFLILDLEPRTLDFTVKNPCQIPLNPPLGKGDFQ